MEKSTTGSIIAMWVYHKGKPSLRRYHFWAQHDHGKIKQCRVAAKSEHLPERIWTGSFPPCQRTCLASVSKRKRQTSKTQRKITNQLINMLTNPCHVHQQQFPLSLGAANGDTCKHWEAVGQSPASKQLGKVTHSSYRRRQDHTISARIR